MRILFDSKKAEFKTPFGCVAPGQTVTLHLHIPTAVSAWKVEIVLCYEDGSPARYHEMYRIEQRGAYDIYEGDFSLFAPGLHFYYFQIHAPHGMFRLFKQGDDTNMEEGDLWQISCISPDFTTPDWAKGAIIYQIFPDRFHRSGKCNLAGKLRPYTIHRHWDEDVDWAPDENGIVHNNDFFGGNFRGITEKMDYIASLGTGIIYLNPISKAFSNHRYDTGDYKIPDPMLGTEADFRDMCDAAHARGMKVILDGVYSHTGSNSLYFDREGTFGGNGAYCRQDSPFYHWYTFYQWPNNYHSWWNFDTLPTVNKMHPDFIRYVITDEDSVVAHWMKLGADGFRLDVADELPDEFIRMIHDRIREINPEALLMGEVWEDASNKTAYNHRRRYFTNAELDSIMNYPFRTAILNFMRGRDDGRGFKETVMSIVENYPSQVVACNMNLLGTHDTPRILTALVDDFDGSREEKARRRLSRNQLEVARDRLMMASFLQYTLPGCPSLYYADETCMEGYKDPFNRRTYPWGREDTEILGHFRCLGKLRTQNIALRLGDIRFTVASDRHLAYTRSAQGQTLSIYVNRSGDAWDIPTGRVTFGKNIDTISPDRLTLGPRGFCVMEA